MTMLLTALLVASNPAVAAQQQIQAPVPAPTATAPAAPRKKERKICKSDPEFTGSRIEKQICLTKDQWDQRVQAAEAANN